jgi:uroporphyrinogen decarboxylase
MTSRERIITVLNGQIPDRVPLVPFVQEEFLKWFYPDRERLDRVDTVVELAQVIPFDVIAKPNRFMMPAFFKRDHLNWRVKRDTKREGDFWVTQMEITTPDRTLTHVTAVPDAGAATGGVMSSVRKHMLEDEQDIASFVRWLPAADEQANREMREVASAWKHTVGELGITAPWGWAGVFNSAADLWGIENVMMAPYVDESTYQTLMETLTRGMIAYNRPLIEGGVEMIGLQGHMANGRSVSADYFMEHVFPYEKQLIDALHAQGAFTVYHNCGFARSLWPCYRELGMTVWETVAEPPQGDNSLADAKLALGDQITLLGNLDQVNFLKSATADAVSEKARDIMRVGKPGGRYLFACSDFLEKNTPVENVKAMLQGALEESVYV